MSDGRFLSGTPGDTLAFKALDTSRDEIVRYIVEQGITNPKALANWSFAPLGNTTVLFEIGPKAQDYQNDVTGGTIEDAGDGTEGNLHPNCHLRY
ncbi:MULTISPECIES: hypothetical protein [unclassified Ruegeria]|uniref:hypothetical protein n=1 Tax=unclassified Ruegeria TaxID=2625375 RepID=UPI0014898DD2|nr:MULTISPECIES: hypothetical protein [unclassified Ruegeria]NOD47715.1 hypothetical protein [Ruegeria sp. HKCCD5849]NOD52622.1 hypothetical protein [Ruegeria sp. HKCCD5851]NOD66041.1 hypothetical protein [Ruegeria sp. HKCCD7303]NOE34344.1 hypothetical protein [Ruegeria sp. HKCCD7318]